MTPIELRSRPLDDSRPPSRLSARGLAPWLVPALLLAALAALAMAVHRTWLHGLDRYGFEHLQPLRKGDWSHLTDPADAPVASFLMVVAALGIRRARGLPLAAAWLMAFAASFALELIGKSVVERPYANPGHLLWLVHGGFPSGHTMRAVIVAGALAAAWPRARWLFAAWAVVTAALVEITGMHVISEVAGGAIGGLALAACVWAWRFPRRPAADAPAAEDGSAEPSTQRGQLQASGTAR